MAGNNNQKVPLGNQPVAAGTAPQSAWADYETVFTNAKAGMDGVDKDKVKQVVYEMSKGSRFFQNETRKENSTKERVERLKQKAAKVGPEEKAGFQKAADKKVVELESTRDLSRTWMHVDMDAFYASVEELHDPSLANKPMAVGGMGMICTANYEARKFGVRAAMPGFIGKRLCPHLVFAKPDFQKYTAASKEVQEVLREYDPNFIVRSLDEAYLDLTEVCLERNMTSAEIAEELRNKVLLKTRLTCSAGIAPNRLLAKVCSDINKPNGQFVLPNERAAVMSFITSLPIRKVTGIGKVGERVLREVLGVAKCGELLEQRAMIFGLFSNIAFDYYMAVGLGIGASEPPKEEHRKSMSTERTFNTINRDVDLINKLHEIAKSLGDDMARAGLHAKTLTLKLKTSGFEVRSRAVTLPAFISTAEEILPPALRLLRAEMPISIRLMGLRFSQFKEEIAFHSDPAQKTLTAFLKLAPSSPGGQSSEREACQELRDSAPGQSSGPRETDQELPESSSGQPTGEEHRRPDSKPQPSTPASPSGRLESGPSSQPRAAAAHLKAQVATAQFVNGSRRSGEATAGKEGGEDGTDKTISRGGLGMLEARGGGNGTGKKRKDGKIDRLLGKMRKQGRADDVTEDELACATCTFLNRAMAHTCRLCGADLVGGVLREGASKEEASGGVAMRLSAQHQDSALRGRLQREKDRRASNAAFGVKGERVDEHELGICGKEEQRKDFKGREMNGRKHDLRPNEAKHSSNGRKIVQAEVRGDSDLACGCDRAYEPSDAGHVEERTAVGQAGCNSPGKFGQIAGQRPVISESTWTESDVRLVADSDDEFDVVGSLREWSDIPEAHSGGMHCAAERNAESDGNGGHEEDANEGGARQWDCFRWEECEEAGLPGACSDGDRGVVTERETPGKRPPNLDLLGNGALENDASVRKRLDMFEAEKRQARGMENRPANGGVPRSSTHVASRHEVPYRDPSHSPGFKGVSAAISKVEKSTFEGSGGPPTSTLSQELKCLTGHPSRITLGEQSESPFLPSTLASDRGNICQISSAAAETEPSLGSLPGCERLPGTSKEPNNRLDELPPRGLHSDRGSEPSGQPEASTEDGSRCERQIEAGGHGQVKPRSDNDEPEGQVVPRESDRVKCELCGQLVPGTGPQRQEHDDFHVALELHRRDGGQPLPAHRERTAAQSRKRSGETKDLNYPPQRVKHKYVGDSTSRGTLDMFLKRRS